MRRTFNYKYSFCEEFIGNMTIRQEKQVTVPCLTCNSEQDRETGLVDESR